MSGNSIIGRMLGNFEIREKLASGGMATVYVAYQPSMQRKVAVKIMHNELVERDPTFFNRFEREASTIAALQHAHILPVIDFGQDEEFTYLAMHLLDNSLENYMKEKHPLPLKEIARLLDQIAKGLDYSHDMGVIHRDLKPANILLDGQTNCFLADFGIAHLVDKTTYTPEGGMVGTVAYMSPETLRGESATRTSDIYALGIMLYEMLTGDVPFRGDTIASIVQQHLNEIPEPLDFFRADLPEGCQEVVSKALAKEPERRYSSSGLLAQSFVSAIVSPDSSVQINQPVSDTKIFEPDGGHSAKLKANISIRSLRTWFILVTVAIIMMISIAIVIVRNGEGSTNNPVSLNDECASALIIVDYTTAIEKCQQAIELDETYAAPYYNLGVAYEELGDLDEAQAAYQTALKYDSQLPLASYRLAELLLDEGSIDEGFAVVDAGVRILRQGQLDFSETDK